MEDQSTACQETHVLYNAVLAHSLLSLVTAADYLAQVTHDDCSNCCNVMIDYLGPALNCLFSSNLSMAGL
jgi:hypothetical protein